jgi:endonuclease YncB( thermonuclease family)
VATTETHTTAPSQPPTTTPATVVVTQVIDGDTVVIDSGEHIRFIGIDTSK